MNPNTQVACISLWVVVVLAALTACGKPSERPDIDHAMAKELYIACISQPAAVPFECRLNAEALAERRKP